MNTKKYSQKHENKVAKLIQQIDESFYRVNNSGAPDFKCGDGVGEAVLVECKTLTEPQIQQTIKKETLEKVAEEAYTKNIDMGVTVINFGDIEGTEYFIVEDTDFLNLLYYYMEGEK